METWIQMIQYQPYLVVLRMQNGLVAANPDDAFKKGAVQMVFSKGLKLLRAALKWRPALQTAIGKQIE